MEQYNIKLRLPNNKKSELLAIVTKLEGANHIRAFCSDNVERLCRITGKIKKRIWLREGDLVIVKLWEFQPTRADVVWRYLEPEKSLLRKKGLLDWL